MILPYVYDHTDQTVHLAAYGDEETAAMDAERQIANPTYPLIWFFGDEDEMYQHIINRGKGF